MNFNRNQAKALSNTKELELFDSARPPRLNKLAIAELKRLVKRSRTLRDKLKDVKRGQVRSAQTKKAQRGAKPAERSVEKARLFSEVHDTFAARLEKLIKAEELKAAKIRQDKEKAAAKKASAKTIASVRNPAKGSHSLKATTASKAAQNPEIEGLASNQAVARKPTPRAKVIETRIAKAGVPRQNAHISSQNKRNQGKRDSKKSN